MTRSICLALLLVLASYGVSQDVPQDKHPNRSETKCELTEVDYAVYAALIDGLGKPEDPEESWQGKQMLIEDRTSAPMDTKSGWGGWGFRIEIASSTKQEDSRGL